MYDLLYQFLFLVFVGFVFRIADRICRKSFLEIWLTAYFIFSGSIVATGHLLRYLHLADDRRFWSWAVFIPAFILYLQFTQKFAEKQDKKTIFQLIGSRIQFIWDWYQNLSPLVTIVFSSILVIWAFFAWLHLGYVPMQGTEFVSESRQSLETYAFLMSGRSENFRSLMDTQAFWMTGFALWGIGQRVRGFSFGLLLGMSGLTAQIICSEFFVIDGIFISFVTCTLFFLFNYKSTLRRRYLYLAGLTGSLAFGHDNIFGTLLPFIIAVISYTVFWDKEVVTVFFNRFKHLLFAAVLGAFLFIPHHFDLQFFVYGISILIILGVLYLQATTSLRLSDGSVGEFILTFFLVWVATLVPAGFGLSALGLMNQLWAWALATALVAGCYERFVFWKVGKRVLFQNIQLGSWFNTLIKIEQVILWLLVLSIFLCHGMIIPLILYTPPNEWDSMTGHLMKVGYYLQNGHSQWVGGTNWSIDFYPRSLPNIQIYSYLCLDKHENAIRLIHYLSYWISVLSVYGIAKRIFNDLTAAIFSALFFALLPIALIQSMTTETDLVLTAYIGMSVYFLFSFWQTQHYRYLVLGGLTVALALSHKVTTILLFPALGIVGLFVIWGPMYLKKITHALAGFGVGLCLFVAPTGYLQNYRAEGNITAPQRVLAYHGTGRYSAKEVLKYGSKNMLRYSADFLNFDGLRNIERGRRLNEKMRDKIVELNTTFNLEEDKFWIVGPFQWKPKIAFYKTRPYWGSISFGLLLPIFLLLLFRRIKSRPLRVLGLASVAVFVSLSFTAPYDPIKGRYFMNMAIFALPMLGVIFVGPLRRGVLLRNYILLISLIVGVSGVLTIVWQPYAPLMGRPNIFEMDRTTQLTLGRPEIRRAYQRFEELVPPNATVAIATQPEDFEYPLFGENFSRKLWPIHPFSGPIQPIPADANFLFFTKGVIPVQPGDILLDANPPKQRTSSDMPGEIYYLRRLKPIASLPKP
jgi:4-amino-4-deoxy-L-arabinose transferase-like glycosyltransferase